MKKTTCGKCGGAAELWPDEPGWDAAICRAAGCGAIECRPRVRRVRKAKPPVSGGPGIFSLRVRRGASPAEVWEAWKKTGIRPGEAAAIGLARVKAEAAGRAAADARAGALLAAAGIAPPACPASVGDLTPEELAAELQARRIEGGGW